MLIQLSLQVKDLDVVVGGHTNTFLWTGSSNDSYVGGAPAGQNFFLPNLS